MGVKRTGLTPHTHAKLCMEIYFEIIKEESIYKKYVAST